MVSNAFIDRFLPTASGEYVKVYLMLLRLMGDRNMEFSVGALADRLEHTEKDVLRALAYWEKLSLLETVYEDGQLQQVILMDLPTEDTEQVTQYIEEPTATKKEVVVSTENGAVSEMKKDSESAVKNDLPAKTYDLVNLQQDEEFCQLIFVAETYLGRTLTHKDLDLFAYLYENLSFSSDLIEYLIEYCVGGGHKSTKYMEAVALGWHSEGKTTVQQVKEASKAYAKENKQVMKAFGITNRMLGTAEQKLVTKWLREYGLPLDVVVEACNRTMAAIHQPSFEYADKILSSWKEAGVTSVDEAQNLSEVRKKERKQSATAGTAVSTQKTAGNRFHNFNQRDTDYNALLQEEIMKNGSN